MSKYLSSLIVILFGIACGGTSETGSESGGGTSQGGSHAGAAQGGSNSGGSAGKASGGANHAGSNVGGYDRGGSAVGGSAVGGSGTYDPRCPAHQPLGACDAGDTVLSCQYEPGSGCLCYQQAPGTFTFCQRVDPNCTYVPPGAAGAAGTSGNGGTAGAAAAASESDPGAGGFSTKIALPPKLGCNCSAGMWVCAQGF